MIVRSCGDSVRGAGWQTLLAVTRFEVPRPFVLERVRFFPAFLLRLFLSQLRPSEHGETSKMEMAHPLIALQMVSHLRKTPHPLLKRRKGMRHPPQLPPITPRGIAEMVFSQCARRSTDESARILCATRLFAERRSCRDPTVTHQPIPAGTFLQSPSRGTLCASRSPSSVIACGSVSFATSCDVFWVHRLRSYPFHWARLRDNSCARQLRVFCFSGSSQQIF